MHSSLPRKDFAHSGRLGHFARLPQDDEETVLAWYRSEIEVGGWMLSDGYSHIAMSDGRFPRNVWERGDLVLGLGFPRRKSLFVEYPAGTLFELTITYRPTAEPGG